MCHGVFVIKVQTKTRLVIDECISYTTDIMTILPP